MFCSTLHNAKNQFKNIQITNINGIGNWENLDKTIISSTFKSFNIEDQNEHIQYRIINKNSYKLNKKII